MSLFNTNELVDEAKIEKKLVSFRHRLIETNKICWQMSPGITTVIPVDR